jgi:hypothetical protein
VLLGHRLLIPLESLKARLDRTEQFATTAGEISQPGQVAPDFGGVPLIENCPDPLATAGNVGEAQLARQSGALLLKVGARSSELLIERREASLRFGKLSAGGVKFLAGSGCGRLRIAQLAIKLTTPGQVLSILLLKAPDAVPNPGQVLFGLDGLGLASPRPAGIRRGLEPGWQGQEQRQT